MTPFAYDPAILAAVQVPPHTVPQVLQTLRTIDGICTDGDGLKWFNWLYLQVTQAVQARVSAGGFNNAAFLSELDVQFAMLYFGALSAALRGAPYPRCWAAPIDVRSNVRIARIQFALAGVNAHINHDLPQAIVSTARALNLVPTHDSPEYQDFIAVNAILDPLTEEAKHTLHVRLLGDPLPPVSHVEDTIAAWGLAAARQGAWDNSEVLFHLPAVPPLAPSFLDSLDGIASFAGKALLVPAP